MTSPQYNSSKLLNFKFPLINISVMSRPDDSENTDRRDTDPVEPLTEKDEVKNAEENTRKAQEEVDRSKKEKQTDKYK